MTPTSAELVELGDLDELTRHVDRLVSQRDWDGLVDLRDRCRKALERGKQLWPVAAHAEYRLALEAPGPWAAAVLDSSTARFTLGPLPEVAASTHTWADLAPSVTIGPAAALAAAERVVRGEDLSDDPVAASLPMVTEVPLRLEPWEPAYALAEYHHDKADFPAPVANARFDWKDASPSKAEAIDDDESCRALTDLVRPWTAESNGRASVVAVAGSAVDAVAALGPSRFRMAETSAADAVALMAWAAASGGAHGRRRGAAVGRDAAWWALSRLLDVDVTELGRHTAELRYWLWDAGDPDTGWVLRLVVEHGEEHMAWALAATDSS